MKLSGEEIVFVQRAAVWGNIVGGGYREFVAGNVETVDEIHELAVVDVAEQGTFQVFYGVPSHLRYFLLMCRWLETFHVRWKDAEAVGVVLVTVTAHQLHAHTDAKYRLAQRTDDIVQLMCFQISHR